MGQQRLIVQRARSFSTWSAALLIASLVLSACATPAQPTVVNIVSPVMNAEVPVGVELPIQGTVTGENIVRVEVLIDGLQMALLSVSDTSQGVPNFPVQANWTPSLAGTHIIQFNVYGPGEQLLVTSEPIIFTAKAGLTVPTLTPEAQQPATPEPATPTAPPAPAEPTAVPTQRPPSAQAGQAVSDTAVSLEITATEAAPAAQVAATSAPAATTAPAAVSAGSASLTVTVDIANVRDGPGTNYAVIGQLALGDAAPVRGKSADSQWWQISFSTGAGGLGWVFAELVQASGAAGGVAVALAPPTPTSLPITVAATLAASQPTRVAVASTPQPRAYGGAPCTESSPNWRGSDPNHPFCVDQDLTWGDPQGDWAIYENGKSIPLSIGWNLYGANVGEIWLRFDPADGWCPFNRPARAPLSLQFPQGAASFKFNAGEYPNGAAFRVFLLLKLTDGRWVQFGEKRLCIN